MSRPGELRPDVQPGWGPRHSRCGFAPYLRGNMKITTPLSFVRFEPYLVPKKSLTGDSTERVDTWVLQVIFSFTRGELPIFVGQQMDVFIDATPIRQTPTAPGSGGGL